jgi:hypothetical protein
VRRVATALFIACAGGLAQAQSAATVIDATTTTGEKVRLLPNGRWEFVDTAKQADAQKAQNAAAATQPASQGCPPGSQGGLFGIGRCIPPGDPQYNRGTLRSGGK